MDEEESPYEFHVGGMHVRVSFAGKISLERAVARLLGLEDDVEPQKGAHDGDSARGKGSPHAA